MYFIYTIFRSSWRSQIKSIVGILITHINWCLTKFIIASLCLIDGRDTKTISDFQPFFRKFKWFCRKPKTGSKSMSRTKELGINWEFPLLVNLLPGNSLLPDWLEWGNSHFPDWFVWSVSHWRNVDGTQNNFLSWAWTYIHMQFNLQWLRQ